MRDVRFHSEGVSLDLDISSQRTLIPIYDFHEKTSPCRVGCPAGHNIAWALNQVRNGDFSAALELFREESPFPSITGRVCYHPCEPVCNRGAHDEPLAINMLERAMADHGKAALPEPLARHPEQIAVIGSGPAGLTAAYHLRWLGYRVTVYEKQQEAGGVLRYGIPDYRLPKTIVRREVAHLARMGIAFRTGVAVGSDLPFEELLDDHDALFLGIGLSAGRKLPLEGIDALSSMAGLDFLWRAKEGLITELRGRVLVIGGGDVAIDVARSARRLGAASVALYCLEDRQHMPAHPEEVHEAGQEKVAITPGWAPVALASRPDGVVVEMRGVDRLESGRPVFNEARTEVACDHILYAIGQQAEAAFLPADWLTDGRLRVNAVGQTAHPKVFAGGDIAGSYNVVQAIGAAKLAVLGIDCALRGRDWRAWLPRIKLGNGQAISLRAYRQLIVGQQAPQARSVVPYEAINADYFPRRERLARPHLAVAEPRSFAEVNTEVPKDIAIREASRCFHCGECTVCGNCFIYCPDSAVVQRQDGFFAINELQCKGCGQCVQECPRDAMSMVLDLKPESQAAAVA
ncbi:MAG: FAD-dependent oxidoreductase [Candidatus Tectomicrobia bacterium]|nr:FAD-dependent oxidoreductase [Candidatus Tectomicrobia bacterium]